MKVTFTLENTPANDFAHWLEYHTAPEPPGSFPIAYEQGEIFLKGPKFPGDITEPTRLDMGVYYVEPSRDDYAYAAVLYGEVDEAPSVDPPRRRLHDVFYFDVIPIGSRTKVHAYCGVPELMGYYERLLGGIADQWREAAEQIAKAEGMKKRRGPGAPRLTEDEWIYRLAKAQWAEEIKLDDPSKTWRNEIIKEIQWDRGGTLYSRVKLLEDARHKLRRLGRSDPEGLLEKVAQFRKEQGF